MLDPLPIVPFTRPAHGAVTLPGSKSITNRALVLAALSDRTVALRNALFSRDTRLMIDGLRVLGFEVETDEPARVIRVAGRNGGIPVREARIEVGNAGTVARFLAAFVCLRPGGVIPFHRRRGHAPPPDRGAARCPGRTGRACHGAELPVHAAHRRPAGGEVGLDASESSQLLSALLLVAPHARTPLRVRLKGGTVSQSVREDDRADGRAICRKALRIRH